MRDGGSILPRARSQFKWSVNLANWEPKLFSLLSSKRRPGSFAGLLGWSLVLTPPGAEHLIYIPLKKLSVSKNKPFSQVTDGFWMWEKVTVDKEIWYQWINCLEDNDVAGPGHGPKLESSGRTPKYLPTAVLVLTHFFPFYCLFDGWCYSSHLIIMRKRTEIFRVTCP